jgi:hypothetical protein
MRHDPRYAAWLDIADELVALHEFVYGAGGPFAHSKNFPFQLSGPEAAKWIRNKCETGWWYWWDKTTIAGKAEEPLRSFQHVISDSGGLHEETEAGREMIARIKRIEERIARVSKS